VFMENESRLKLSTPSDREIVMTREFNAPRSFVFGALTRPEILRHWLLGPPGWTMIVCEIDLRVGGQFQHIWTNADGTAMKMSGVYREIVPGERIVSTESFEYGCEGQAGEQVATAVLAEANGKTTLTTTVLFPSKEARDRTMSTGMDRGVEAGYARLDDILSSRLSRQSSPASA
jgi:uncharacterized protein YndB with AHSA1/START domain